MSSSSRKSQVNTAACAIAMRAILALAIMGLADAHQTCNEFCDLASRGYVNALCRPDCLCSFGNGLSERSLDIIIKSSNIERTRLLDDSPIFYEPAETYPYGISLDQPFFFSPSLRKAIIPNSVNRKLKRSGITKKLEFQHTNKIKTKESRALKLEVDTKELPLYLDIGIQKMDDSARTTHNNLKGIKNLQRLEQSFEDCFNLQIVANSRKDGSNNQLTSIFYDPKIDKYSSLSDSELRIRIKKMCELPVRIIDESLKEIRRPAPKKSTERTKKESTTKSYIENILQSRIQHAKKKTAVQDYDNSFQHSRTTNQPDSSIYYIKTLERNYIPETTTNQYYNELIHSQQNGELNKTTSTPYIQEIVNLNTLSGFPLTLSTTGHQMPTFLKNIRNSVTESPETQDTLASNFIDLRETANIDSVNGFESTVESYKNNSFVPISKEIDDDATEAKTSTVTASPQTQHTLTNNFSDLTETATTDYVNSLETTVQSKTNNSTFTSSYKISDNAKETKRSTVTENPQMQHTPPYYLSEIRETATISDFETTVEGNENNFSLTISNEIYNTTTKVNTLSNLVSKESIEVMKGQDITPTESINYSKTNVTNYLSNSTLTTEQTNVLLSNYKNNIYTHTESSVYTKSSAKNNDTGENTDMPLNINSVVDSTVPPSQVQTLFEDNKQNNHVEDSDLLHDTSNIVDYFTYLESMGTKNLASGLAPNEATTPNEFNKKNIVLNATTESTASINVISSSESVSLTTDCTDTKSEIISNNHNQDNIKATITITPGSTLRVEYIESELDIPTILTREFTNETVVSKITGFETALNNDENITSLAELQATPTTINVAEERDEETLLEDEIVGDLYIVFNKYFIPARFIQDAKGKIKLGIDGATLCEKIAQKGLNNSLIWSALCNCSQSKSCANNVFK